jgi:hypothetical protein
MTVTLSAYILIGPLEMIIGGERKTIVAEDEPRYSAAYELESADVLCSRAWAKASVAI